MVLLLVDRGRTTPVCNVSQARVRRSYDGPVPLSPHFSRSKTQISRVPQNFLGETLTSTRLHFFPTRAALTAIITRLRRNDESQGQMTGVIVPER